MPKKQKLFPDDFYWGASTASYQVEGGNHTQWTVWELGNAAERARTAEHRWGWLANWESIEKAATQPSNYISGRGVDHYNRYKDDFKLLNSLNLNAFRFGVEWARIEPEEGRWDEAEIAHYHEYIDALKKRGVEPFLNIWHWTMPVWFTDKGGFKHRKNLKYFERLVQKISDEYGGKVGHVFTINEPNVYASFGYITGEWPPEEKNVFSFIRVYYHLTLAHKRAYRILKKQNPHIQVGLATQMGNIQAKNKHDISDRIMVKWMRYFWNWWFVNRVRRYQDFVGFNYYFTDYYRGFRAENPKVPVSDMGWYMEPEGLYPLLLCVRNKYRKPIYITENGLADASDEQRQWWIEETIVAMERAISEGVDVRGYFHWSLLDNFEWAYGWWPKFGLVSVDRKTMKRTIRPSARWFAQRIVKLR